MTLQLDFWMLVGMLGTLLSACIGMIVFFGKTLIIQFENRLDERFAMMDKAREAGQRHIDDRFTRLEQDSRNREREVLKLKADLPVEYLRREDAIREQVVINAKLDAVAAKMDTLQLLKADVRKALEGKL